MQRMKAIWQGRERLFMPVNKSAGMVSTLGQLFFISMYIVFEVKGNGIAIAPTGSSQSHMLPYLNINSESDTFKVQHRVQSLIIALHHACIICTRHL